MRKNKIFLLFLSLLFIFVILVGCNDIKKPDDPVDEHTYGTWIEEVSATCEEDGIKGHYHCSQCDGYFDLDHKVITDLTIPKTGHDYGTWIEEVSATCEEDGIKGHYHCSKCDRYFDLDHKVITDLTISKIGHTLSHVDAVAATCVTNGNIEHFKCDTCLKYYSDENATTELKETDVVVDKLGHILIHRPATEPTYTVNGNIEHYECSRCGKLYSDSLATNEIQDVVVEHVILSVSEAKQITDSNLKVTVEFVIVGASGNYDGGYVWYIVKDLETNETCALRKSLVSEYGVESTPIKGYSYAPTMIFPLGSIVRAPISVRINPATKGGEKGKIMFIWRGDDYNAAVTEKTTEEWFNKYIVGNTNDYRLDLTQVKYTINSQESLTSFLTDTSNPFAYQLVCLEGTEDQPLKFTTKSGPNGVGDINRSYLFLFYDNPSTLSDTKIAGSYPVLSNFGNTYNFVSPLTTLLGGQTEYEDVNLNNPYTFIGKIYCMIIGGSTAYYHFVILNEDDILPASGTLNYDLIHAKVAKDRFFKYMEDKAAEIGINIQTPITSAVGVSNVINTEDMVRIGIAATKDPKLMEIWNTYSYTTTYKDANNQDVTITVPNKVLQHGYYQNAIAPYYTCLGAKGGSLSTLSASRDFYVANLILVAEGPNNTYLVGAVAMRRKDEENDNRYTNTKILFDILVAKSQGLDTSELEASITADHVAGVIIPKDGSAPNGYDWFGENSKYINYTKDGKELIVTASCWKTMTGLCALSYMTDEHFSKQVTIGTSELSSIVSTPKLEGGEIITLKDALYFMMLASSNVTPSVIARSIGEMIVRAEHLTP